MDYSDNYSLQGDDSENSITAGLSTCDTEPSVVMLRNQHRLCDDLEYVINMPDLCDVMFLVGPQCTPVHGVRAILATRSRTFYQMILQQQCTIPKSSKQKSSVCRMISKLRKILSRTKTTKKRQYGNPKLTIQVNDFEADIFMQLMKYIHCGVITLNSKSVVGLLNAAHIFCLSELRTICWEYALSCITPSTIRDLIVSARKYTDFKQTDLLMQRVLTNVLSSPDIVEYSPAVKQDLIEEFSDALLDD